MSYPVQKFIKKFPQNCEQISPKWENFQNTLNVVSKGGLEDSENYNFDNLFN